MKQNENKKKGNCKSGRKVTKKGTKMKLEGEKKEKRGNWRSIISKQPFRWIAEAN